MKVVQGGKSRSEGRRAAARRLTRGPTETNDGSDPRHGEALVPLLKSLTGARAADTRPHPLATDLLDVLAEHTEGMLADVYSIDRDCTAPLDVALLAWRDAGAPRTEADKVVASSDLLDRLRKADRAELQEYLEGRGFAVHDSEPDDVLRTAALLDAEEVAGE